MLNGILWFEVKRRRRADSGDFEWMLYSMLLHEAKRQKKLESSGISTMQLATEMSIKPNAVRSPIFLLLTQMPFLLFTIVAL